MEIPWDKLLRAISDGQVLPILGPGVSTIAVDGEDQTIRRWLAPKLAERLGVSAPLDGELGLNEVAVRHLMKKGDRIRIYEETREIIHSVIKRGDFEIPQTLRDLASITDFDLFITSSFDPFLGMALEATRPGFQADSRTVGKFYPGHDNIDLPDDVSNGYIYHILGDYKSYPDFGVWEEDYMEFICGLIEAPKDTRRNLFRNLRNRSLLLIGSPFDDWMVRFFLRVAKGQRLSDRSGPFDYLAENPELVDSPLVFFFDHVVKSGEVLGSKPEDFIRELSRRWKEENLGGSVSGFLDSLGEDPEKGCIFISYSHDDLEIAAQLAIALKTAGLPVWMDKNRLKAGGDWESHLKRAVKKRASLFISLISRATESDVNRERFVHREREWAADEQMPGYVFYIPVIIDDTPAPPQREPEVLGTKFQSYEMRGGKLTGELARLLKKYHKEWTEEGEVIDG